MFLFATYCNARTQGGIGFQGNKLKWFPFSFIFLFYVADNKLRKRPQCNKIWEYFIWWDPVIASSFCKDTLFCRTSFIEILCSSFCKTRYIYLEQPISTIRLKITGSKNRLKCLWHLIGPIHKANYRNLLFWTCVLEPQSEE